VRVSTPLKRYSPYKNLNELLLANASARGTWVHEACVTYASGAFLVSPPTEYAGYLRSFQRWHDDQVIQLIAAEIELVDPNLDLTGHPDFLFILKQAELSLIDIKTPLAHLHIWEAQLAAYYHLVANCSWFGKPDLTASLQLDPNGGVPKMTILEKPEDHWWGFYHAFMAEKYFNPKGEDDGEF
jgi:hypothetical protein